MTADDPKLGELGAIFVSLAAGEKYAEFRQLRIEEARRELTELLLDARVQAEEDGQLRVRAPGGKARGIDVTARLAREGRLLVVTSLNIRPLNR